MTSFYQNILDRLGYLSIAKRKEKVVITAAPMRVAYFWPNQGLTYPSDHIYFCDASSMSASVTNRKRNRENLFMRTGFWERKNSFRVRHVVRPYAVLGTVHHFESGSF